MHLVISGTEITTDSEGRYSLNDLHKASGSGKKDAPALFMQNKNFKDFIDILNIDNPMFEHVVRKKGRYNGGTWVCRELVYKYAMWVNPSFELKVIQTFDKIMASKESPETMMAMNELTKKIEGDKDVASACGRELAKYKKVRKENQEAFAAEVKRAQLSLGFEV